MDFNGLNGFTLRNLTNFNVLLGKNGCGKSHFLKIAEQHLASKENVGKVRYISPERGGSLVYDAGVDQQIINSPTWMASARRQNQSGNFRQQSASLFRRLELNFLREIEKDQFERGYTPRDFQAVIDQLNELLDRVKLVRHAEKGFEIQNRQTNAVSEASSISSGEAELISLGIELLSFGKEADPKKDNVLLIDEPDVHLHPDLQDRLAKFIINVFSGSPVTLVLATHSTPLLAGLASHPDTSVSFMRSGNQELVFKLVSDVDKTILPIFGAHPLSNIFNQAPVLLIEGEDDERIWQQVFRTSQGQIKFFPCVVESINRLAEFEAEVGNIIGAVYDDAKAFSLRDRDLEAELIEDVGPVVRMRLSCRTAENLMLSDDVLIFAGIDWKQLQALLNEWVKSNPNHQYLAAAQAFIDGGLDRKGHDLKEIRNILIGLFSNKPWEVLVGQSIAKTAINGGQTGDGSLRDYLGDKVCRELLRLEPTR